MLELVFELGINLIETCMIIDFVMRYLGNKYQGKMKNVGFISAWLVSFAELSIINHIAAFEGIGVFIPVVINFIYALIFLNGSILLKLWISALVEIIMLIIAVGTNLFVCSLIGYDPNDMLTVFNSTRVISVIITKILLFYVTRILLRHKYKNPIDKRAGVMLILIPLISVISISALMLAAMNHEEIKVYILFGTGGILTANIITYYFFTTLNKDYETKLKIKLLEQHNDNAKQYISNADAFVKQMKSAGHDMRNQLFIIYSHIEKGKYDEAKSYIRTLTQDYLPDIQNIINTENDAFDAIVNAKIAVCNQKKIYIEVKEMKDSLKNFDALDTCILFGNLLDNAIEAAQHTENRRITVDISTQAEYLSIIVSNSIVSSVLENNNGLKTSKRNKELHGIGIKNIKNVVKKYNGMMQFYEEKDEFCCHILLDVN